MTYRVVVVRIVVYFNRLKSTHSHEEFGRGADHIVVISYKCNFSRNMVYQSIDYDRWYRQEAALPPFIAWVTWNLLSVKVMFRLTAVVEIVKTED